MRTRRTPGLSDSLLWYQVATMLSELIIIVCCPRSVQNVPAEKLFSRERAVQQLLAIVDRTSMRENGRFFDWKGEEVEW